MLKEQEMIDRIKSVAEEKGAENIYLYDVKGKISYTDFFMVMSASNERQVMAIADYIKADLKKQGEIAIGNEGSAGDRWVLVDFGNVVCHIFHYEERDYYDLDDLYNSIVKSREE